MLKFKAVFGRIGDTSQGLKCKGSLVNSDLKLTYNIHCCRSNVSLETILSHPEACRAFVNHMKTEFAEENVEFWHACRSA